MFEALKAPSINKLEEEDVARMRNTFEELRHQHFPAIWVQLARNVTKDSIFHTDFELMKTSFDTFESELGKGFAPRKKIDQLFLEVLDLKVKDNERFLSELYLRLLKETCLIKRSALEV